MGESTPLLAAGFSLHTSRSAERTRGPVSHPCSVSRNPLRFPRIVPVHVGLRREATAVHQALSSALEPVALFGRLLSERLSEAVITARCSFGTVSLYYLAACPGFVF